MVGPSEVGFHLEQSCWSGAVRSMAWRAPEGGGERVEREITCREEGGRGGREWRGEAPAWGYCVGFISRRMIKDMNILRIMETRFLTVREGIYKYKYGKNLIFNS